MKSIKQIAAAFTATALLILLMSYSASAVEPEHSSEQYIRLNKDDAGQLVSLDTALVAYRGEGTSRPIQVDLASAVHVGEKSYYQELNELFRQYDAVLYELVAPSDHRSKLHTRKKTSSVLSSMQMGITDLLNLSFQLEEVDYTASNFVHADLSPSGFVTSMNDRGETFSSMFMKVLAASMVSAQSADSKANSMQLMYLLMKGDTPDRAIRLRRVLAAEFSGVDTLLNIVNGDTGSTLVAGRNDRALEVLKEQISLGKSTFVIFYGGAHMPDFDYKLKRDFGLKRKGTRWLEAWNLRLK